MIGRASSLQYDIIAGMLMRQPHRPSGRSTRCSSSSASSSSRSTSPHEPVRLLGARLLAVGDSPARRTCRRRYSRIHAPSEPTAGSSSTSARDQIGPRGSETQRDRPAERMPDDQHRCWPSASSRSASAATLASSVHGAAHDDRPCPSRSGASEREVRQMLRRQRLPPLAVSGQPVDGQNLGGPVRAVAVHIAGHRSRRRCYGSDA